jgi:hypothetical protein
VQRLAMLKTSMRKKEEEEDNSAEVTITNTGQQT